MSLAFTSSPSCRVATFLNCISLFRKTYPTQLFSRFIRNAEVSCFELYLKSVNYFSHICYCIAHTPISTIGIMPNEYPLIIRVHSFITYLKLLSNSIKGLRTKRFSAVSIGASLRCTTLFNIVTSVNKRLLIGVQVNQAQVHGQVAAYGFLEPR